MQPHPGHKLQLPCAHMTSFDAASVPKRLSPVWHEVAGVQDDRWQHEEEERVRVEVMSSFYVAETSEVEDDPHDDADHDQETRLGKHVRQLREHVESWNR